MRIGTSGWQYRHWRGRLYPRELPVHLWLSHYADRFATVEVDSTFYRLPDPATVATWAGAVPEGFVFASKASRYLTHVRRLRDPAEPVGRMLEHLAGLGDAFGPVLLQLSPRLQLDLGRLADTLACFPPGVRVAVEPRHPSWFVDGVADVLSRHRAALCLADLRGPRGPLWRTAPFGYLRFHAGRAEPDGCYGTAALGTWAERVAQLWPEPDAEVFAYFNNDAGGCAVRDARLFGAALARAGVASSRVPGAGETPVG